MVFAALFGESKFDHLCGDLAMVLNMRVEEDMTKASALERASKIKLLQTQREQRLAKLLAARLDGFVTDPHAFVREAVDEVYTLSHVNLGPQMLLSIGIMYELTADREVGVRGWIGLADAKVDTRHPPEPEPENAIAPSLPGTLAARPEGLGTKRRVKRRTLPFAQATSHAAKSTARALKAAQTLQAEVWKAARACLVTFRLPTPHESS